MGCTRGLARGAISHHRHMAPASNSTSVFVGIAPTVLLGGRGGVDEVERAQMGPPRRTLGDDLFNKSKLKFDGFQWAPPQGRRVCPVQGVVGPPIHHMCGHGTTLDLLSNASAGMHCMWRIRCPSHSPRSIFFCFFFVKNKKNSFLGIWGVCSSFSFSFPLPPSRPWGAPVLATPPVCGPTQTRGR